MPRYEFRCPECGCRSERTLRIADMDSPQFCTDLPRKLQSFVNYEDARGLAQLDHAAGPDFMQPFVWTPPKCGAQLVREEISLTAKMASTWRP